jgi:autotransporter-associated beta strand protein
MSKMRLGILFGLALGCAANIGSPAAYGTTYTWTSTTSGTLDWTTPGNWSSSTQYVSDPANELMFYADSTTFFANNRNITTNVPATLSMNTLTLNGRGNSSGAVTFTTTIASNASTWTIGDGSTSIVNLNANFGATAAAGYSTVVAANLTLNQANTLFTGNGTGGFTFSGNIGESGSGYGITKNGTSALVLSGTNSTYSGNTTLSGGTLQGLFSGTSLTPVSPFGASTLVLNTAGTTLQLRASGTVDTSAQTITFGNSATVGANMTINVDRRSGSEANKTIALGALGIGANTLTVTGANNYSLGFSTTTLSGNATFNTTTGNLSLAGVIGDGGSGYGFTKNGAATLVLSGSNTYSGPTNLSAGTLSVNAAGNLGNAAADLLLNGGTLQITGTALTNFASLGRTNPVVFTSGQTVGLDINNAANVFTVDQTLNQGAGGLVKAGAGTLLINTAQTYTGTTTISGGTLQLNSGGSIAGSIINNALYMVNQNATAGTSPLSRIAGSGSIAAGPSATITINTATGLSFNAINTTGGGSFALSGVTTPTFGGLSGTAGNLSAAFSSGYSGVTNLTLNTAANNIAGNSFTYGGVIDGTGLSLTKTGAGTQTLTGNNTYTGTTFLNGGTLAAGSGATIGRISGTTAIEFNGGTLQFNRSTNANIAAIPDGAAITVNSSSTFGVTSQDSGGASAIETVGAVTLSAGQMNFNATNSPSSGSVMLLSGLSRSGTASANFNGLHTSAGFRWQVSGAAATAAGQIIGPWYTTGGNNAGFASTDYAVYLASGFISPANIAGSAETAWTTAANAYTMTSNQLLTNTRTITALRSATGAGGTLTLATGANLETYGLLSGAQTLAVNPGTGGVLTTPTGGGNLYISAGAGAITVGAPINNNGGNVTLVKNGSGTLTLTSTTSNFSGGVVLNAGVLSVDSALNIGGTNNSGGSTVPITVNGSATVSMPTNNLTANFGTGAITIANGATLTVNGASRPTLIFGGAVTGDGGVTALSGSFWAQYRFNSTANTFTGAITDSRSGNDGINNALFSFNSIADGAGYGNIILNGAANSGITYGSGAIAPLTLNHRQVILANNNTVFIANASSQAMNINTDIGFSGTGARQIQFGVTGAANHGPGAGINTINGMMTDNVGGAFTPTVGGGTWAFSNSANTYTGATTISAGTLEVSKLANGNATSSIGASSNAATNLHFSGAGRLRYVGSGDSTDRSFRLSTGSIGTIDSSGTGAVLFTNTATPDYGTVNNPRGLALAGSNTAGNTLAAVLANNGGSAVTLTKQGDGRWILTGANTYTGATSIEGGVLEAAVSGGGLPTSSILQIRGGVFQSSGTFSRSVGTAAGNVNWSTSSGGFAAIGSNLLLNLNGGTASVTWNGASMVSTGQTLVFGSTSADSLVDWQNALNLGSSGSGQRTIHVNDNTGSTTDIARISGQITNTSAGWGINKTGAGTLELTNANTYTGATTVSAGTLVVNNTTGSGTGTGAVTISSLATLGGNGTISGATTIDGFHTPGNSPGIQTFGGGLTYNGTSTLTWELIDNTAAALDRGVDYDGVSVTGGSFSLVTGAEIDLAFGGTVDFLDTFWSTDQEWLVVDLSGGATASDSNLFTIGSITGGANYSPALGTFGVERKPGSNAADSVYLTWVAVPEPSALALAGLGVAGVAYAVRRRRKA